GWAVPVEDIVDHIEMRLAIAADRQVTDVRPAIGLSPRQITAITVTATASTVLAAVLAGLVLGLPLARRLIDAQGAASGMGAGLAQHPPAGLLLSFGAAAVLGAAVLAALPAHRATRRRPADASNAVA
ncbi:FtsX-like permease family protein, partial [Streptomyces minutiscleroticus]|uniref:FtsX-like permease family protein n=1 Tax=Streptomyces minutiscleroticus TaxID=68238 RepID=UPI00331F9444